MADYTLESMPPEILHCVFRNLHMGDRKRLRRANTFFAEVGEEHVFKNIQFWFKRQSLAQVDSIAQHPRIALHVKSLRYQGDAVGKPQTIEEWKAAYAADRRRTGTFDQFQSARQRWIDQQDMRQKRYDVRCLMKLFQRCPNLSAVTVAFGDYGARSERGHALGAVARAAREARNPVQKLEIVGMAAEDFDITESELKNLRCLASHLHGLEIHMKGLDKHRPMEAREDGICRLNKFLHAASKSVTGLTLTFPCEYRDQGDRYATLFRDVLGQKYSWPKLHTLVLRYAEVNTSIFSNFVRNRVPSLVELTLSSLNMINGTWVQFFSSWGGQVPNLRVVTLEGDFGEYDKDSYYNDDDFLLDTQKTAKAAVVKFLVEGGQCPQLGWDDECPDSEDEEDVYGDYLCSLMPDDMDDDSDYGGFGFGACLA